MLEPYHTDLIKIIRDYLLEGLESAEGIKAELYKLNTYGKGSFSKPYVDTPRNENMFGSLVVVFPTPHEGGALLLRKRGREWIFDSGRALADVDQPTIGYVAFFSNVEHEVAPVTSGHRITLTYNLYFDDAGPVSKNDAVYASGHFIPPQPPNQEGFRETFKALLENPEFMADGGTLVFGLRHVYPIKKNLKHVYNVLKASDAVVYQSMRALGFEPLLHVFYDEADDDDRDDEVIEGAMIDEVIDFNDVYEEDSILDIVEREGGMLVRLGGWEMYHGDSDSKNRELVEWVTPRTTYNRLQGAFAYYPHCYGIERPLNWVYGEVCMIVRIGKAGDRLGYPTALQVRHAYAEMLNERGF